MLEKIDIENVLFLDIETVPACAEYSLMSERMQKLWDKKSERISGYNSTTEETATPEQLYGRAGIYAEFGKIICISVGAFMKGEFRIKSYSGDDEKVLLTEFAALLTKRYNRPEHLLCAHNGKEFDFPYMARRMLVHGIPIPFILDLSGKKPWEVSHLDTMELWKFGDYKNYTSLELLAAIFGIATPKDDIDGSQVAAVYYKENDLARIVHYCTKDVLTVAQIFRRYRGEPLIEEDAVVVV
ncbi:MAG: 3'-5' exonuclease [Bacteroidota bacterium]